MVLTEKIKDNSYLMIPMGCIAFYAIFYLIRINFIPFLVDFATFYASGKQILAEPSKLYNISDYYYMPSFACFFVLFIFFEISTAYYIFYVLNYFFALLFVLEFNKILILKNIKDKFYRIIFLLIISNGWIIYYQFYHNQTKFIVVLIFMFIIRREIQFKEELNKKNIKFYIINYGLFIFAIAIVPILVFLLLIYVFNEIQINKVLKKENLQKFGLVGALFIIQNFLFFLYPQLFFSFISRGLSFQSYSPYKNTLQQFYFREFFIVDDQINQYIRIISIFIFIIYSFLLIYNQKLLIEEKFSFFCLIFLFLDTFNSLGILVILIPFICLLFVKYIHQDDNYKDFIKNNWILLIGLFSITGLTFMIRAESIFNFFPGLKEFPLIILVNLRWIFLLSVMVISLFTLHIKRQKCSQLKEEKIKNLINSS